MKSNYKAIGELVERIDERNRDGSITTLIGVSIDKKFIPSVANVVGTDLTNYKVIRKYDFAVSLMQVSRDEKIPAACQKEYDAAIMSPAYPIFRVKDTNIIMPEYLEMWFMRSEFDREASFVAVGGVRGSMPWEEFAKLKLPVPNIEIQKEIVSSYRAITDRITLKKQINDNLERTLKAFFTEEFMSLNDDGLVHLGELISFGNGKTRPKEDGIIPIYGGNGVLSYTNQTNAQNVVLIGRVGAYCGSIYLEEGECWVSDNAIFAKSKLTNDEYFDYFLLKSLNLYEHHIGTGQQLLTQSILNKIEVPAPKKEKILSFNTMSKELFSFIASNNAEISQLKTLSSLLLAKIAELNR